MKLTDFGLARRFKISDGRDMYSFCGSPIYIAPETLAKKAYDHKVDYYAMGTLLYEMIIGVPPFNFKKAALIKEAKLTQDVEYPSILEPKIKDLLMCCLHKNPDKRIADFDFYAVKLKELGVDMNIIQNNRYHYKLKIGLDFDKSRQAMEPVEEHSYYISNQEIAQKMENLDNIFYFRKDQNIEPEKPNFIHQEKNEKEDLVPFSRDGNFTKKLEAEYQTNIGEEVTDLGLIDMMTVHTLDTKKNLNLGKYGNTTSYGKDTTRYELAGLSKSSNKRLIFE